MSAERVLSRADVAASPSRIAWLAIVLALITALSATPGRSANAAARTIIVAQVNGLSCPFCAYGLRKELLTVPGVRDVRVSLAKSQATVTVTPGMTVTDEQVRRAIRQAGFSPGPITRRPAGS